MKTLLIIGASGLTGYKLANSATQKYHVYGTYNNRAVTIDNCEIFQLDKTDKEGLSSIVNDIKPDIIVDCSALHNVDYCETHQEETWNINVKAPLFIADLCKKINARLIYISTDYVFDGMDKKYDENSEPNPLNFYGKSKLKAEEGIANSGASFAIARTSLVYGWNPGELKGQKSSSGKTMNYVIWALNKLRNEEIIQIVTDQFSTPTLADNLAEFLFSMADSNINGLFHTVGKECINRYEFTLKIAEVFEIDKSLIKPTTSDMFKQDAKRPMRCCLDVSKAERLLNVRSLTIEESLMKMKKQEEFLNN
ncbi:MAG: dTDP-4-dehydrorhamnose reductase [Promethearchaeota archaeon]